MVQKRLVDYVIKNLRYGFSKAQIKKALGDADWATTEITDAFFEAEEKIAQSILAKTLAPAPKKSGLDLNLGNLTASQILLYLGSIIIIIAGIIYVGIHWEYWGPWQRILAFFIPMILVFSGGIKLWMKRKMDQAIILIFTGAVQFPFFLSVTLKELKVFEDGERVYFNITVALASLLLYMAIHLFSKERVWSFLTVIATIFSYEFLLTDNSKGFGLTVSLSLLALFILLHIFSKTSIWSLLAFSTGILNYYFLLAFFHIDQIYGNAVWGWAFLLLGIIYGSIGLIGEKRRKKDMTTFPYVFGFVTSLFALWKLASDAELVKIFTLSAKNTFTKQDEVGWSYMIMGILWLAASLVTEKMKRKGWNFIGAYTNILSSLGTFIILGSLLFLSLQGERPFYETLLLIASVGAIFISIPKSAPQYLYLGTLFLIIYIFDIGAEYFKNDVGWPITLFVAGFISIGVSFFIENIRKKYFAKKNT